MITLERVEQVRANGGRFGQRPTPTHVEKGDYVPNGSIRRAVNDAVQSRGWSWSQVASEARMDEMQLRRSLGSGTYHRTRYVRYDHAVAVLLVLGLDPVDFGV